MGEIANVNNETGTLGDNYSPISTDSGDLSIHADAGLAGTGNGLRFVIDDTNALYCMKAISLSTNDIRTRIILDPKTLTMGANDNVRIFYIMTNANGRRIITVWLSYTGAAYQLFCDSHVDGGALNARETITITDAPHLIEIHVARATADDADDAEWKVWIDGSLEGTHSDFDLYDDFQTVDRCVQSALDLAGTTSGEFYMDELIVRDDDTEIGPVTTTLSADSGSFGITGTAATGIEVLTATAGSFAITGTAATTMEILAAGSGAFQITGTAATTTETAPTAGTISAATLSTATISTATITTVAIA